MAPARPRVLVVDDDVTFGRSLGRHLERLGYASVFVETADEVRELVGRERFDIVLSDLHLRELDGVTLVRCLVDVTPTTRMILMTGDPSLESALEAIDVEIAQTEFDRQVRFRERNVGNQQDLDTARRNLINAQRNQLLTREAADLIGPRRLSLEAQIASQQSQVDLAELNRQRTTIVSPIDGVLQSIDVEVGENLAAGQPIARVVALSPIEVPSRVPASARATLAGGDRVILRPTSGPADARTWTTTLSRIAPEEDAATRTLTVYADLTADDQTSGLLPSTGMFLAASVWVATAEDRFLVPRRAIRAGRIQVAQNGEVVSQPVDVAYTLSGSQPSFGLPDDQWSVSDDVLEEGDLVIVNAATQVPDGTAVEAKPVNGDSAKASLGAPAVNPESSEFSGGATP